MGQQNKEAKTNKKSKPFRIVCLALLSLIGHFEFLLGHKTHSFILYLQFYIWLLPSHPVGEEGKHVNDFFWDPGIVVGPFWIVLAPLARNRSACIWACELSPRPSTIGRFFTASISCCTDGKITSIAIERSTSARKSPYAGHISRASNTFQICFMFWQSL